MMSTLQRSITRRLAPVLPVLVSLFVVAGLLASQVASASAYSLDIRWPTDYTEFRSYVSGAPFPSDATSTAAWAALSWDHASTGKDLYIANYQNRPGPTRISVSGVNFSQMGWGNYPGISWVSRTQVYPYTITGVGIYMNSQWSWNSSCTISQTQKRMDYPTALLHEFGHTVSLNDITTPPSAVMYPNFTCKRSLTSDDLAGLGWLYP